MAYKAVTPMLQQYFKAKAEHPEALLAMRVGDFYEFYGEDAEIAAKALEITLTGREDGGNGKVSMAGVPFHAVERYAARLIKSGFKLAICDQVEDPKTAKGLVRRKVTRVLTPGSLVDDSMLDSSKNNYLVAAVMGEPRHGLSVTDISTGEFLTTEIDGELKEEKLFQEILRLDPAEILVPKSEMELADKLRSILPAAVTVFDEDSGPPQTSKEFLLRHFGIQNLKGFGCDDFSAGLDSAVLTLKYLKRNEISAVNHITTMSVYSIDSAMWLDSTARRHLELTQNLTDTGKKNTLLAVIDKTHTPMGARLIRRWLDRPLIDLEAIHARQDAVSELIDSHLRRAELTDLLKAFGDIERPMSRCAVGTANPRDVAAIRDSLLLLPKLREQMAHLTAGRLVYLYQQIEPVSELTELLVQAMKEEPPISVRDGGIIKPGYSLELDKTRERSLEGREYIAKLEQTERERAGINNLKVGYNSVFGYYIEIPKSQIAKAPPEYDRRQTTANAERYTTSELREFQAVVTGADERIAEIEFNLFNDIRSQTAGYSVRILAIAKAVAELDTLIGLALVAQSNHYVRPVVDTENRLNILGGRHPVVEQFYGGVSFVPNDTYLDSDEQKLIVLTGPNMSGKSTYLRQTALICILAQMGSYVPADSAEIGITDRVFTRVGARDDLATGQSTFMVEMTETANILNNATQRSLVVLDEIGRGTSTYDGLAIAWAVVEALVDVGCKTLFATHYHHLNDLAGKVPGIKNYRVTVKEHGDSVIWLHKVLPGGTDRSYGIQVARMAGVPLDVVERAADILRGLEKRKLSDEPAEPAPKHKTKTLQLTLFDVERAPILDELDTINITEMTPVEALMKLDDWRRRFSKS